MCETLSEYSVNAMPPNAAASMNKIAFECVPIIPAAIAATSATRQMAINTVRLSVRSDQRPIGSCVMTAARMLTPMNVAMSLAPSPINFAYTGPIENNALVTTPETTTATRPIGDNR